MVLATAVGSVEAAHAGARRYCRVLRGRSSELLQKETAKGRRESDAYATERLSGEAADIAAQTIGWGSSIAAPMILRSRGRLWGRSCVSATQRPDPLFPPVGPRKGAALRPGRHGRSPTRRTTDEVRRSAAEQRRDRWQISATLVARRRSRAERQLFFAGKRR